MQYYLIPCIVVHIRSNMTLIHLILIQWPWRLNLTNIWSKCTCILKIKFIAVVAQSYILYRQADQTELVTCQHMRMVRTIQFPSPVIQGFAWCYSIATAHSHEWREWGCTLSWDCSDSVPFITAIFLWSTGLFLARKMPKLLYNVTTDVFLVTTRIVVTLLWHCSEIFSQVDFLAILCCHSLKNQRVSPYSHYKTCSIFVVEFFAYIERNLLEIIIRRLVVTFSLNIDANFSQQEVPMVALISAVRAILRAVLFTTLCKSTLISALSPGHTLSFQNFSGLFRTFRKSTSSQDLNCHSFNS